jgi:hypothetical protein
MENIEPQMPFIPGIDIRSDITQRVAYVKSGS